MLINMEPDVAIPSVFDKVLILILIKANIDGHVWMAQ